jgi:hypothetical protein
MPTKKPASKKPASSPPTAHKATTPDPVAKTALLPLDEASGAAALARLQGRLLALPVQSLAVIHYGVRLAATSALGLWALIEERGLRSNFEALAKAGLFDLTLLDALPDLGRALWFVRHRLDEQVALGSRATLPTELLDAATELRRDMLRVLEFRFGDDADVTARLDFIRRGTGHQDLADDLMRLGGLYHSHATTLHGTPSPYRAGDGERASKLAAQILMTLGQKPSLEKTSAGTKKSRQLSDDWSDLQSRCATLLEQAYDEVAAAGRFLCRHKPDLAPRFASLTSIARNRRQNTKDSAPTPNTDDPQP